jgi:hypothetical protein
MMRTNLLLSCLLMALLIMACDNPFLPPTGAPLQSLSLRSSRTTPEGVIEQLLLAYESRRLESFIVLLSPANFRFYIPVSVASQLDKIDGSRIETVRDSTFLPWWNGSEYVYVSFAEERRIHQNLFTQADELSFVVKPQKTAKRVFETIIGYDTTLGFDTLRGCGDANDCIDLGTPQPGDTIVLDTLITPLLDTTLVVLEYSPSELMVRASRWGRIAQSFELGRQVFYLAKGSDGLWEIRRWYELDL